MSGYWPVVRRVLATASGPPFSAMLTGMGHAAAVAERLLMNSVERRALPHHKLIAYQLALALVQLVARTRIGHSQLRAQSRKSAVSAALNVAEGAARESRADKSRLYAMALAECCECCAAIEIASALGACPPAQVERVIALGTRLRDILRKLAR